MNKIKYINWRRLISSYNKTVVLQPDLANFLFYFFSFLSFFFSFFPDLPWSALHSSTLFTYWLVEDLFEGQIYLETHSKLYLTDASLFFNSIRCCYASHPTSLSVFVSMTTLWNISNITDSCSFLSACY